MANEGIKFIDALEKKAKMFSASAKHAYLGREDVCGWLFDPLSRWAQRAYGNGVFEEAATGYVQFCINVSKAQQLYEKTGKYTPEDLPDIVNKVYQDEAYMTPYMWAAILIYGFWPSMTKHIELYRDEFVEQLPLNPELVELACGHGVMGLLAAEHRKDLTLVGYDIGPAAIGIANKLSEASGLDGRAKFQVQDILALDVSRDKNRYDGVLAAMLAEHLVDPEPLFRSVHCVLKPGGIAFISTAIESAQRDHVYEFHNESELVLLAEKYGLRTTRLVSDIGTRVPNGRFLPRATALIATKGN